MDLRRGSIVIGAPTGRFSKPRPALVLRSDAFIGTQTVLVALITSDVERLPSIRVPIQSSAQIGLRKLSEIMVDMLQTIPIDKFDRIIGHIEAETLKSVETVLRLLLDLP